MNVWGDPTHRLKRQLDRCKHFCTTMQQSHTAWNTIAYLWRQNVTLIEPDMWPPNSLDLNLVNYTILVVLHFLLYAVYICQNHWILPTHSNVTSKIVVGFTWGGPSCMLLVLQNNILMSLCKDFLAVDNLLIWLWPVSVALNEKLTFILWYTEICAYCDREFCLGVAKTAHFAICAVFQDKMKIFHKNIQGIHKAKRFRWSFSNSNC